MDPKVFLAWLQQRLGEIILSIVVLVLATVLVDKVDISQLPLLGKPIVVLYLGLVLGATILIVILRGGRSSRERRA